MHQDYLWGHQYQGVLSRTLFHRYNCYHLYNLYRATCSPMVGTEWRNPRSWAGRGCLDPSSKSWNFESILPIWTHHPVLRLFRLSSSHVSHRLKIYRGRAARILLGFCCKFISISLSVFFSKISNKIWITRRLLNESNFWFTIQSNVWWVYDCLMST